MQTAHKKLLNHRRIEAIGIGFICLAFSLTNGTLALAGSPGCPEDKYACDVAYFIENNETPPEDHFDFDAWKQERDRIDTERSDRQLMQLNEAARAQIEAQNAVDQAVATAIAEDQARRAGAPKADAPDADPDQGPKIALDTYWLGDFEVEPLDLDAGLTPWFQFEGPVNGLEVETWWNKDNLFVPLEAGNGGGGEIPPAVAEGWFDLGDDGSADAKVAEAPADAKVAEAPADAFNYDSFTFPYEKQVGFLKVRTRMGINHEDTIAPISVIYTSKIKDGEFRLRPDSVQSRPRGQAIMSYELVLPEGQQSSPGVPRELGFNETDRLLAMALAGRFKIEDDGTVELPAPFDQIKRPGETLQEIVIDNSSALETDPESVAAHMAGNRVHRLWGMQLEMVVNGKMTNSRVEELEAQYRDAKAASDRAEEHLVLLKTDEEIAVQDVAAAHERLRQLLRNSKCSDEAATEAGDCSFDVSDGEGRIDDVMKLLNPAKTDPDEMKALQAKLGKSIVTFRDQDVPVHVLWANRVDDLMDQIDVYEEIAGYVLEASDHLGELQLDEDILQERLADAEFYLDQDECEDCPLVGSASFPRIPGKYRIGAPKITEFKGNNPVTAREEDGKILYIVNHDETIELYYPIYLKEQGAEEVIPADTLGRATDGEAGAVAASPDADGKKKSAIPAPPADMIRPDGLLIDDRNMGAI